jgi:hypothetical protein
MSSADSALGEYIRAQIGASDSVICCPLDERPPLRIEQNFTVDPIRDDLLAGGLAPSLSQQSGQRRLASGDLDRSVESGNVRFIHGHPKYTNRFVSVNNPVCVTSNKGACTLQGMSNLKSKRQPDPAPSAKRVAKPGTDGQTLGQRVAMAMAYATGRRGGVEYTEVDLLKDVNRMAGDGAPLLSQQSLNAIRGNKVSRSSFTHLIAKACGVNSDWLAYGIGKMTS